MADRKAIVLDAGKQKQIPDADSLVVGASAKTVGGATLPELTSSAPANVTKAAAAVGVATTAARADHKHDITTAAPAATGVATASGEGVATTLARSDHTHQSNTAPANVTKATAAIGTSGEPARADHKHDITTATAVGLTDSTNAEGVATSLARSDHTHAHGNRGGGSLHALAIASGAAGFMSGADKSKLDGITAGANGNFVQTVFNEITVDTTTTSATFVTLLSQAITIQAGSILIFHFTAGASNAIKDRTVEFRVLVDGVVQRGVGLFSAGVNSPNSVAMVRRVTGLAAGSRTVVVEWRRDAASGTAQVRPVTAPDDEHASLLLMEVRA